MMSLQVKGIEVKREKNPLQHLNQKNVGEGSLMPDGPNILKSRCHFEKGMSDSFINGFSFLFSL